MTTTNNLSRVLFALILCTGLVVTGCKKDSSGEIIIPEKEQVDVTATTAVDLSSKSSANCYIVPRSGWYKFKTVKGNSAESVGSVSTASVLWRSFGTDVFPTIRQLVKKVVYSDGYIAFEATDHKGNVVIAAKDADGKILWSWHIWLTDQPEEQVYNNAGTMMDRNLGATSVTPGEVTALGLLYQWGRKDPFLGSSLIGLNELAVSTYDWPSAVGSNSETGTIDYVTANPTTFVTSNRKNYDWYYTGSASTDNTRWQSEKTIYDPCPPGWRVPDGGDDGVWSKADFAAAGTAFNTPPGGISFSISSTSTAWYPAPGSRDCDSTPGMLSYVGVSGFYWSVTPTSTNTSTEAFTLYIDFFEGIFPSSACNRANGFSVRCLKITDEVDEP